jgi:outer membrane lipoprotein LolB
VRFRLLGAALLLLSGCASLFHSNQYPPLTDEQQSALQLRQQALAPISAWNLRGRLSLKTEKEAWTGKLRWQQSPTEFRLHFDSPTGQGVLQLMSNPQFGVEMRVAEGGVYYADDAATLLYDHTGWRLPVAALRQWLLGLPQGRNQIARLQFDERGLPVNLEQYQWRIQYLSYQTVNGYNLPRKIILQNDQINIRMVIDQWEVTGD